MRQRVLLSRGAIVCLLTTLAVFCAAGPAAAQNWYETYEEGVSAVRNQDWNRAEPLLTRAKEQAQAAGVRPGPSVRFYGMQFRPFIPDYYLGIVYANTGRYKEAQTMFTAVQKLVPRGEAAELNRQVARVQQELDKVQVADNRTALPPPGTPPVNPNTTTPGRGSTEPAPPAPLPAPAPSPIPAPIPSAPLDLDRQRQEEYRTSIQSAEGALKARRYLDARKAATAARATGINNADADQLLQRIEFEQVIAQAASDLAARRFDAARSSASNARAQNVDNARANQLLGQIELEQLLDQGAVALAAKRYADARSAASAASKRAEEPGLRAIEKGRGDALTRRIDVAEAEDAVRTALAASDVTSARTRVDALRKLDARNAQLAEFTASIVRVEEEVRRGDLERRALRLFFAGKYEDVIKELSEPAAQAGARPRLHFYLACSNAALALLKGKDGDAQLKAAQEQYRRAQPQQNRFTQDRRYISPRILEALERVSS